MMDDISHNPNFTDDDLIGVVRRFIDVLERTSDFSRTHICSHIIDVATQEGEKDFRNPVSGRED